MERRNSKDRQLCKAAAGAWIAHAAAAFCPVVQPDTAHSFAMCPHNRGSRRHAPSPFWLKCSCLAACTRTEPRWVRPKARLDARALPARGGWAVRRAQAQQAGGGSPAVRGRGVRKRQPEGGRRRRQAALPPPVRRLEQPQMRNQCADRGMRLSSRQQGPARLPLLDTGAPASAHPAAPSGRCSEPCNAMGGQGRPAIRAGRRWQQRERPASARRPTHMLVPLLLHPRDSLWSQKGRCMPVGTPSIWADSTQHGTEARCWPGRRSRDTCSTDQAASAVVGSWASAPSPPPRSLPAPAPAPPAAHPTSAALRAESLAAAAAQAGPPGPGCRMAGAGRFSRLAPQVQDKIFSLQVQGVGRRRVQRPGGAVAPSSAHRRLSLPPRSRLASQPPNFHLPTALLA